MPTDWFAHYRTDPLGFGNFDALFAAKLEQGYARNRKVIGRPLGEEEEIETDSPGHPPATLKRLALEFATLAGMAALLALLAPGVVRGLPLAAGVQKSDVGHEHPGTPTATTPTTPTPQGGIPTPQGYASVFDLYAQSPQRVGRPFVTVRPHLPLRISLSATLNRSGASSAFYRLPTITRSPLPHLKNRLFLRLPKAQRRTVTADLRQRTRIALNVTVTATDKAGKQSTATRTINLALKVTKESILKDKIVALRNLVNKTLAPLVAAQGVKGPAGPPGPAGAPGRSALSGLGPNETIRGVVGDEFQVPRGSPLPVTASATFPIPIPFGIDDGHVVVDGVFKNENGDTWGYWDETQLDNPNNCTGSAEEPTAPPGFVCIYPYYTQNVDCDPPPQHQTDCSSQPYGVIQGSRLERAQKWGFQVTWVGACEEPPERQFLCTNLPAFTTQFFANWAYTAPADTPPPAGGHEH